MRSAPGICVAICAGIAVGWSLMLLVGCASVTHENIEKTAYEADDQLCVTEATSKDAGTQCLDKYQRQYAVFWADSGVVACDVDGGAK